MKKSIVLKLILSASLIASAPSLFAADTNNMGQFSSKDYKFVCEAAKGGMAEVDLGKIATEKATDPKVKEFAQKMVDDHSKANDELKQLVTQKGASLPDMSDRKETNMVDHLSKLSGSDFDKAYVHHMVKDHKTDIAEFKMESEKGTDADLKAWADKTLPTLKEHLSMIQMIAKNGNYNQGNNEPIANESDADNSASGRNVDKK